MLKNKRLFSRRLVFLLVFMTFFCLFGFSANALSAEDYAPVFYFESEETCYPVDVSYHIDNSYLKALGEQYSDVSYKASDLDFSTLSNLFSENDIQYTYLDNTLGSIDNNKVIKDYQSKESSLGYKVYYRIFEDSGNQIVQYWMFYAFNDGDLNKHEGDWEMVQVVVPSDGSKNWVAYSQHHSGQTADWNQVEKKGYNIKVYVARGSHANYLRSYSGKLGIGMGSDYVGAGGKVLKNGDYDLEELSSQDWLSYSGRWGEVNSEEDLVLGRAGPFGPKYRESGSIWNNPISWGNSLSATSESVFIAEWLVYHFVEIFIAFNSIVLLVLAFKIYRRHKKYGLGPRIISMLYINGFNLRSIGNILCFVGIILAVIGLFNNWYSVSGDINIEESGTSGLLDIITVNGIEGVKMNIPSVQGSIPVGSIIIPFSIIFGLGLVLMIVSTIGLIRTRKLGWKYFFRGIRLFTPIIFLIIMVMAIGSMGIVESTLPPEASEGSNYVTEIMNSFTSTPWGGEKNIPVSQQGVNGNIYLKWGLGSGAYLLIFGGITILFAGILEIIDNKNFFEPKVPISKKKKIKDKNDKNKTPPVINQPAGKEQIKSKDNNDLSFCTLCGSKLEKDSTYCKNCGKKIK